MARFKPGQQIVCVRKGSKTWRGKDCYGEPFTAIGPAYNEIVTVHSQAKLFSGSIVLCEYLLIPPGHTLPQCYDERAFEPLADIRELTEILESVEVETN